MKNNSLNWFEIPVTDMKRATQFYSQILDTQLEITQCSGMEVTLFPYNKDDNGAVGGCLMAGEGYQPSDKGSIVYLGNEVDLNTILNRVESANGKVLTSKTLISEEVGHIAYFQDTEGNRIGLHSKQ